MYRGLDSFRALAFFAVFAFHCGLFPIGHLGVQAFFVLSGFLLIPILVTTREKTPSLYYFMNFYGKRALRIFPLYYLYLFIVLIITLGLVYVKKINHIEEINQFIKQIPWGLTFTYNLFFSSSQYTDTKLMSHLWSLAVEEQFYLIAPIIFFCISPKMLKRFLLAIILLGPVIRVLIAITAKSNAIPFFSQEFERVVYALAISHFDAFFMGGYFALYFKKGDRSNTKILLLLYASVFLGYFTEHLSLGRINFFFFGFPQFMPYGYQYIWGYSLVNFLFARFIIQFRDDNFFPKIFNNAFLVYLGKISYGLYMLHYPIIWLTGYLNPSLSNLNIAMIALLPTIIISSLLYEFYEKRFLALKEKFFSLPLPS